MLHLLMTTYVLILENAIEDLIHPIKMAQYEVNVNCIDQGLVVSDKICFIKEFF